MATEKVAFADLVGFVCLKALAYDDRHERKDAHDIVYCIEHWRGGPEAAAEPFRSARRGKHGAVVQSSLDILAARFADGGEAAGYLKDGPVAVAKFEQGERADGGARESRALRQRNVSELVARFVAYAKR